MYDIYNVWIIGLDDIDGLVHDRSIFIASTLQILQSYSRPSIYIYIYYMILDGWSSNIDSESNIIYIGR